MAKVFEFYLDKESVRKFERNVFNAKEKLHKIAGNAAGVAGSQVMIESKDLVPLKWGALQASGHVTGPTFPRGREFEVVLSYGGPGVDYAIIQHETPPGTGPGQYMHAPGRQWKYLEEPFERHIDDIFEVIKRDIEHFFKTLEARA